MTLASVIALLLSCSHIHRLFRTEYRYSVPIQNLSNPIWLLSLFDMENLQTITIKLSQHQRTNVSCGAKFTRVTALSDVESVKE